MKSTHYFFLFFLLFSFSSTLAQSCDTYFPFQEGIKLEYQHLNKKGKLQQTSLQEISQVKSTGEGMEAVIQTQLKDKKGKELAKGSYSVACKGNTFYMDMSNFIPDNVREMGGESEMKMTGDGFVFSTDPKVGDQFPDSENLIEFKMGPMNMKMTINITDHKVEAKESVTTDAGTFDCFKISYVANTKFAMSKSEVKVINWYAKGVGTVKTESYNAKNDKLQSIMELTKFTR